MRVRPPYAREQVGLTLYERKALMALMVCGIADAATLCREGSVPTSKIYLAMEKLAGLGLVQVQPTRPKMFAALPSEVVVARIVDIVRERSDRFAADASTLQAIFLGLRSRARGRQRNILDASAPCQDTHEDRLQHVLGVGCIAGDTQSRAEHRLVMALV